MKNLIFEIISTAKMHGKKVFSVYLCSSFFDALVAELKPHITVKSEAVEAEVVSLKFDGITVFRKNEPGADIRVTALYSEPA